MLKAGVWHVTRSFASVVQYYYEKVLSNILRPLRAEGKASDENTHRRSREQK